VGPGAEGDGQGTPYIAEALEAAIKDVSAVVVLITPDDIVRLKTQFLSKNDGDDERKPLGQARPNVLFESGMAFARHPEKTIFVTFVATSI
jgi:predicted nucleotide-binding protein